MEISDENFGIRDSEKCPVAEYAAHSLVSLEACGQLGRKSLTHQAWTGLPSGIISGDDMLRYGSWPLERLAKVEFIIISNDERAMMDRQISPMDSIQQYEITPSITLRKRT